MVSASDAPGRRARRDRALALAGGLGLLPFAHLLAFLAAGASFWGAGDVGGSAACVLAGLGLICADLLLLALARKNALSPLALLRSGAGLAWTSGAALAAFAAQANQPAAQAALFAGLALSALAFAALPAALLGLGAAALAGAVWAGLPWPLLLVAAGGACAAVAASLSARREPPPAPRIDPGLSRFASDLEESGQAWFWETDAEGLLTYASPALAEEFGRAPAELVGRPFLHFFQSEGEDPTGILKTERSLSFYLSARTPFRETAVRANLDQEIWWSVSGRPLFDEDGQLAGFRGSGADLSERKRAEAELWKLARFDSLTGLPNRGHMQRILEAEARKAVPGRSGCALLLLDLDKFKEVNDNQGHLAGDELLCQVGKRLAELVGKRGHVGRLGGDEFKIVLPRTDDRESVAEFADRCISYLRIPYRIGGRTFSIGASIGIATVEDQDSGVDELVRRADLALYAAKGAGRGTFRFFEPEMHTLLRDRQVLEHDLKEALAEGGLSLVFQPAVETATETLAGFEALIRWEHREQGYISPEIFIAIAEQSGLIIPLGEWILRTACAEAAKWPRGVNVAVNISPVQFRNPNLPAVIVSALASAQLPAGRLELEITEGVFLDQDPKTDEIFETLKGIGVRLALDDFGTGYSSFGYLKKAPFDKIKVDQSFVRGATVPGSRNATILKAIVDLADGLGMDTTAEGAETQEELELVRGLGCSHVQGFVFGRPMDGEAASRLANERGTVGASGFVASREARQRLIRSGLLHLGPARIPILVRNVSEGGALIESGGSYEAGTAVTLEIPGCGAVEAEVRWSAGNRTGLRFRGRFDLGSLTPARTSRPAAGMLTPDYIVAGDYLKKDKAAGIG